MLIMSFGSVHVPEVFDDRNAYVMMPDELLQVPHDEAPLLTAPEALREFGVNAPVQLTISASDRKPFFLLDTRQTPGGVLFPDRPNICYDADYLLVDTEFSADSRRGYKGIRTEDEEWVDIGRAHLEDRFSYPSTTSRDHFRLRNFPGFLAILNQRPTNRTLLHKNPGVILPRAEPTVAPEDELVPRFDVGLSEQDHKGEDRSLIFHEAALYGVFDGVGGHQDGAQAAELAATVIREAHQAAAIETASTDVKSQVNHLKRAMQLASTAIAQKFPWSGTTGLAVRIISTPDTPSGLSAVWTAVGDSLMYHVHNHELRPVNEEEGFGRFLSNHLGRGEDNYVRQAGHFALQAGDQLILTSDGITGDYDDEILSPEEILAACDGFDAQTAAQNLLDISRKQDDKTAVVITI